MNKLKILIVEDEAPLRNLIRTTLYTHDYAFETAENGRAALMIASSLNPDLVLLDLGLPDMDGIEGHKKDPVLVQHAHHRTDGQKRNVG